MNFDEDVLPTVLDPEYTPDELDEVSAHASACGMIYSFYGRLSVASMDEDELRDGHLPPTFYCYGTEDPFYRQFEAQYALMQEVGTPTERIVLQGLAPWLWSRRRMGQRLRKMAGNYLSAIITERPVQLCTGTFLKVIKYSRLP